MNKVKYKLNNGLYSIGTWLQLSNVSVAEIIGNAGYDWVAMDLEHGFFSPDMIGLICLALEKGGTIPFARVAQVNPKDIKQALDAGVKGLVLPMIKTAKDLQNGISWAKYPPYGSRGVGYSRANLFGRKFDKTVPESSKDLTIIAQIEHITAVQNLDEILEVKGLDGIMVGPYDLSASMGITAEFDNPDFISVMDKIKIKAENSGVPMGSHIVQPDPEVLCKKIQEGYKFIAYGIDAVFLYNAVECPVVTG
ncbi:HpcH/HpaI aldolase family protein [Desulfobacula toluolica]|uniref:2-dehydro-3-deoxyglucarate aldolase n=1 Tax=Desulfobacula toluolica (strain DSM 7467 / Tol2) TaxID=651182 RepID=K0NGG6_DESTT|nr:aldolase/citrate lyase family protein [Desulfobacula toluolica]CCK80311.1 2-dehydro-3-deoxyglucarate aldolase [Desulfobacula toluolica Tol2]